MTNSPPESAAYLLRLLEQATTPEELDRVEQLLAEANRPRVRTQEAAAKQMGITRQRLRDMEKNAPWWRPEFRNGNGYDVAGITDAQTAFHGDKPESEEPGFRQREMAARAQILEHKQRALELEWRRRQGNILPADVYAEFIRELLGMIRAGLEELPENLADDVPPEFRQFVFVPPDQLAAGSPPAPLQRAIGRLLSEVDEWLNTDPAAEVDASK